MAIPYLVGGSVASSIHGISRPTMDLDIVAAVQAGQVAELASLLRKLEWYRAGGESSQRQWNDLRGILQVSQKTLDLAYLRRWAVDLKVADLLERLMEQQ